MTQPYQNKKPSEDSCIVIGVVTYANEMYCRKEFFDMLSKLKGPNLSFVFVTNSDQEDLEDLERRSEGLREKGCEVTCILDKIEGIVQEKIVSGRNKIREVFLQGNGTHLYFIDSDVFGPSDPCLKFSIKRLLMHV
jgi:hypothetical protein